MAAGFNVYHGAGTHFVILTAAAGFLLPAATFGWKYPVSAGLWLIAGAAVCFLWRLSVILDPSVHDLVRSEVWRTIFWICGPLLLLGLGFLRDPDKTSGRKITSRC